MYDLSQNKLLIASHNEGKISEFRELLKLLKIDISSSKELKLRSPLKKLIIKFFDLFGYELKRKNNFYDRWENFIVEINDDRKKQIKYFQGITLASEINLWSIYQSLNHIKNENIEGDIVECGVYNGNTLAFIGEINDELNLNKKIWGYDTFDGFVKNFW